MHQNMQRYLENVHIYGLTHVHVSNVGNKAIVEVRIKKSSVSANNFYQRQLFMMNPPPPSTRDYKKTVVGVYGSLFPRVGKNGLDHDKKRGNCRKIGPHDLVFGFCTPRVQMQQEYR
jgi:hypothetical protein